MWWFRKSGDSIGYNIDHFTDTVREQGHITTGLILQDLHHTAGSVTLSYPVYAEQNSSSLLHWEISWIDFAVFVALVGQGWAFGLHCTSQSSSLEFQNVGVAELYSRALGRSLWGLPAAWL